MSDIDEKARELLATPIVKSYIIGGDDEKRDVLQKGDKNEIQRSSVIQGLDETERAFALAGAIEPPYNPATLTAIFEHSNSLRPNIDAYVTNIDAHGHRFEPILDLDANDIDDRLDVAIAMERASLKEALPGEGEIRNMPSRPSPEDIQLRKDLIKDQMRYEKVRLENFFDYCCNDMSFSTLRRHTRQDLEVMGNGFWEVLRNGLGEVAQFTYIPGFTMRLLPLDSQPIEVGVRVKQGDLGSDTLRIKRRFRRYIQVFEAHVVYFKEFGDPRVISRRTGRVFDNEEQLIGADSQDGPATELIHFRIHNPRSAYGVPRWSGQLLAVLGSRQAEEINYLYFENKSVPPLALLVSGGRVTQSCVDRLKDFVENEIKGKKNFHKMMIIEAEPGANTGTLQNGGQVRITLQPLTQAQQNDALFQKYDERNIDKVGMAFRIPRLLRGDVRDFNRATAEAALQFAESQVFSPEREEFDFIINRKILSELGIQFYQFKSNAPTSQDPVELTGIIKELSMAGVLTPEEAREHAEGVFNKPLKEITEDWVKKPLPITLKDVSGGGAGHPFGAVQQRDATPTGPWQNPYERGLPGGGVPLPAHKDDGGAVGSGDLGAGGALVPSQSPLRRLPPGMGGNVMHEAKRLLELRKALLEAEKEEARKEFERAADGEDVEIIRVSPEKLAELVEVG